MAFIEIEMYASKFNQLMQVLASTGPIPIGVVNGLGPDRLIAAWSWDQVAVGMFPPGYLPPFGTLTARCNVTLRHVSTAELDADPNAAGTTTPATAWVSISPQLSSLQIQLLAIEVAGAPVQWLAPALFIARQGVPSAGEVQAAALILYNDIVTLRLATQASDPIQATPANLLATTDDEWSIRLSGEMFAEQILKTLNSSAAKLPAGTSVEDSPSASWENIFGTWAAVGSIGLVKEDACPGLFGDVDMSTTIHVTLVPSADTVARPPQLTLNLDISSDVSDWDTFRCWLGSFGIASMAIPIVGGLGGIISLIAVAETVRLDAGREVTGRDVSDFKQVSRTSTTASYTNQRNLPTLVTTSSNGVSNGLTRSAVIGAFGMLISGTLIPFPAAHTIAFAPNGGVLASRYYNSYDCDRRTWKRVADVAAITVSDKVSILGTSLGLIPVRVFPSSSATPPGKWSLKYDNPPTVDQYVSVVASSSAGSGDGGRVYLHTSAGIRRFDIEELPQVADPTPEENIFAVARCWKDERYFTPKEKIGWLVDPPGYDFGYPPLRQWLFTFADLPAGTHIIVRPIQDGVENEAAMIFSTEPSGEASLEFLTDAATELVIEHNQESLPGGRVFQRWLLPTEMVDIGEPGQGLLRSGSSVSVIQANGVFTRDLATGLEARQENRLQAGQTGASPFSLTLPGGRVAALMENRLVIGVPMQTMRAVESTPLSEQTSTGNG